MVAIIPKSNECDSRLYKKNLNLVNQSIIFVTNATNKSVQAKIHRVDMPSLDAQFPIPQNMSINHTKYLGSYSQTIENPITQISLMSITLYYVIRTMNCIFLYLQVV